MPQPSPDTSVPPAKARRKAPLLVAAGTLLLLSGAGVVMFSKGGEKPPAGEAEAEHGVESPGETSVISLAPFVLNLADAEDERFLRLGLTVVVAGAAPAQSESDAGAEEARMRDRILTVLATKGAEEVISFEGKEALRQELKQQVAELLADRRVVDVLFTEFLVQ